MTPINSPIMPLMACFDTCQKLFEMTGFHLNPNVRDLGEIELRVMSKSATEDS